MAVRWLGLFVLVLALGHSANARGEDPPPFAFEWYPGFSPQVMSIDPAGNLWIVDYNSRIHRARRDGNPLDAVGESYDLACDASGGAFIFGCDESPWRCAKRIHADGGIECEVPISKVCIALAARQGEAFIACGDVLAGSVLAVSPECGTRDLFAVDFVPGDLDMASDGSFFIIDPSAHRVVHLDPEGTQLNAWTVAGNSDIVLSTDTQGRLFVGCGQTVQVFDLQGSLLTSWGNENTFGVITGIAVNALGDVYVADGKKQRIRMYGTRQPSDNPPPPPLPPPPPPPSSPLTLHPAIALLHIASSNLACTGPSRLDSVITSGEVHDDGRPDIVYLIVSPQTELVDSKLWTYPICGVQVGITYDPALQSSGLEVLGWHSCSDLEFPGDDWPGSGSGNTSTWASHVITDVVVVGYFEVIAHGPSRMSVIPWPNTGQAKFASCGAWEYALEVPPDRLGWVSWGGAGFGLDTNGCNPVLEPCTKAVPVQPSTWGRLKNQYGH